MSERCHNGHPVLKLAHGELVGGSCINPREGFDIYVGFDWGMEDEAMYPWNEGGPIAFRYKISDQKAPSDLPSFRKLVTWLCSQLKAGKRIHIGCLGGHGRTGLVIAAVVSELLKEKDPIAWVRKHHCEHAVESQTQVNFLVKHYKAAKAQGSHAKRHKDAVEGDYLPWDGGKSNWPHSGWSDASRGQSGTTTGRLYAANNDPLFPEDADDKVTVLPSRKGNIWGRK